MSSFSAHLVRRGVETFHASSSQIASTHDAEKIEFPAWAATLILGTVIFFSLALLSIQYTYGELISTLASIESPSTTAIIRVSPPEYTEEEAAYTDQPDAPLLRSDEKDLPAYKPIASQAEEIHLIEQKPLTSRFCRIRRHLRAQGGRLARYRGLHIYLLNAFIFNTLVGVVSTRSLLWSTLMEIGIYTALTSFTLLWTHHVISAPSSKTWIQRFPSRAAVKKALLPTLTYAAISKLSTLGFIYITSALGTPSSPFTIQIQQNGNGNAEQQVRLGHELFKATIVLMLALFLTLGIQIPLEIAITRVRASLLPSTEESIVPFDRSFNGAVIPEVAGGKGVVGLWAAWVGCSRQTRLRVLGVYLKTAALQILFSLIAIGVVVGEVRLALGPEWIEKMQQLVRQAVVAAMAV